MITKEEEKIDIASDNYKIAFNSDNIKFQKLDEWLEKESKIFVKEIVPDNKNYKKYKR